MYYLYDFNISKNKFVFIKKKYEYLQMKIFIIKKYEKNNNNKENSIYYNKFFMYYIFYLKTFIKIRSFIQDFKIHVINYIIFINNN